MNKRAVLKGVALVAKVGYTFANIKAGKYIVSKFDTEAHPVASVAGAIGVGLVCGLANADFCETVDRFVDHLCDDDKKTEEPQEEIPEV